MHKNYWTDRQIFFGINDKVLAACRSVLQQWDLPLKRYLKIISWRESKGNGSTRLCKTFSEKWCNNNGLKTLVKKLITLALSIDCQVLGVHYKWTCTSVADWTWWTCWWQSEICWHVLQFATTSPWCFYAMWVCGFSSWLHARPSTPLRWQKEISIFTGKFHCYNTDLKDVKTMPSIPKNTYSPVQWLIRS